MKSIRYFISTTLIIIGLLLTIDATAQSSSLNFEVTASNLTNPSSADVELDDVIKYTIIIHNTSGENIQNTKLIGFIPAGTSYIPNSTRLNGNVIVDVSGKLPYSGSGANVQATGFPSGLIPAGFTITVEYQVLVTANGGFIHNNAYIEGIKDGVPFNETTSTTYTTILPDASCTNIYQAVGGSSTSGTFNVIRRLNTTNGTVGTSTSPGSSVYDATNITKRLTGYNGGIKFTVAISLDRRTQRLYFVNYNGYNQDLCYIDMARSTPRQYCFKNTRLTTVAGINKMAFTSDGWGYAITHNNQMMVRFKQDPITDDLTIEELGTLINDPININTDILDETGGDIFADGSGNLYLIANSNNLYRINTTSRIATYLGTVNPLPSGNSQSMAIDANGTVYIGGRYNNVMKINLATMEGTNLSPTANSNIYYSGDYASCNFPVISPVITANKTWRNLSRDEMPRGGDTIEYRIEIINTGNINAAGVKVYDSVPSLTAYVAGSTKLNGVAVADISGNMPFSEAGGMLINSPGQDPGIIRPTATHKAVLTFNVIVQPLQIICNQSRIFLLDANNDIIHVNSRSNDPSNPQSSTCFFTDGVLTDLNIDFKHELSKDKHDLTWKVNDPTAVKKYELELSSNGYEFYPIHEVNNNIESNDFRYEDRSSIANNTRYYRLKVTKFTGEIQYSVILRVQKKSEESLKIITNPVKNHLNYQFNTTQSSVYFIRVIDLNGAVLQQERVGMSTGIQVKTLALNNSLRAGMYLLEINDGKGNSQTKKFIKQ